MNYSIQYFYLSYLFVLNNKKPILIEKGQAQNK